MSRKQPSGVADDLESEDFDFASGTPVDYRVREDGVEVEDVDEDEATSDGDDSLVRARYDGEGVGDSEYSSRSSRGDSAATSQTDDQRSFRSRTLSGTPRQQRIVELERGTDDDEAEEDQASVNDDEEEADSEDQELPVEEADSEEQELPVEEAEEIDEELTPQSFTENAFEHEVDFGESPLAAERRALREKRFESSSPEQDYTVPMAPPNFSDNEGEHEWEQLPVNPNMEAEGADDYYESSSDLGTDKAGGRRSLQMDVSESKSQSDVSSQEDHPAAYNEHGNDEDETDQSKQLKVIRQRDGTTTQEGWMAVRVAPGQWQERFGVIQPGNGLFAFEDEIAAHSWRRSEDDLKSSVYETRLLASCEQLRIVADSDLSTEADEATNGEYALALALNHGGKASVSSLIVAFPETTGQEWIAALEGSRPLADYFSACEKLNVLPVPSLVRSALMDPPLRSIHFEGQNLSDIDQIDAICMFAISSGRNIHRLHLQNCQLYEEEAILLRDALLRLTSLQELSLADNPELGDTGVCALLSGIVHSRLRVIDLENCGCSDEAALELSELVARSPGLELLTVARNNISSLSGVRLALALSRCPQVKQLRFSNNIELEDEFMSALCSSLPSLRHIKVLDLSGIAITAIAMNHLEKALKDMVFVEIGQLERIDLRNNPAISEKTAAKFLEHTQLAPGVVLFSHVPLQIGSGTPPALLKNVASSPSSTAALVAMEQDVPSTSSFVEIRFAGTPIPTRDRLKDALQRLLAIRSSHIRVKSYRRNGEEMMEVEFVEDADEVVASRCLGLLGESRLALLRVQSMQMRRKEVEDNRFASEVASQPSSLAVALSTGNGLATTPTSQTKTVTLDILASSAADALLTPSSMTLARLARDLEVVHSTLSPLMNVSLEQARDGKVGRPIITASCGLSLSNDAAVASEMDRTNEYDLLSAVQCAASLGDLKRLRSAVLRSTSSSSSTSFAKRLADILTRSYSFRFAPEFPLREFSRCVSVDGLARPLTRPLTIQDEEQHRIGCSRVSNLIQMVLGYLPRHGDDVDGSAAASELFGVAGRNESLIAELHLDLLFRTCYPKSSGKIPPVVWALSILALRCVPPSLSEPKLRLCLEATYKVHFDKTEDLMALHCLRAVELNHALMTCHRRSYLGHPMRRLEYLRRSLRMDVCPLTVLLSDGSGVNVDVYPFTTFLDLLLQVDEKIGSRTTKSHGTNLERWRGFHFVERNSGGDDEHAAVLHYGDDPTWWFHRTGKSMKLCLEPVVSAGFVPLLLESDPVHLDENVRGDSVRVDLCFAEEKQHIRAACEFADDPLCVAYVCVLGALQEMGEDRFRTCSIGEMFRITESQFPLTSSEGWTTSVVGQEKAARFREACDEFRASLLAMPIGSLSPSTCRAAFVQYARLWPLSGMTSIAVKPKQMCSANIVIDSRLPAQARIGVSSRGGLVLLNGLDFRSCVFSCDLKSLARIEMLDNSSSLRFVVSGEEDWLVVAFSSVSECKSFHSIVLIHLWAVLANGGVSVSQIRWLEEFTFRFPVFPVPPPPPRFAIPPGGTLKTRLSKNVSEVRTASLCIVDGLFRPRFDRRSLPAGAFFYGPLEQCEVISLQGEDPHHAQLADETEASFALPPLAPPPPLSLLDSSAIPLPLGPPPIAEDVIHPPSHPPPDMHPPSFSPPVSQQYPTRTVTGAGDAQDLESQDRLEALLERRQASIDGPESSSPFLAAPEGDNRSRKLSTTSQTSGDTRSRKASTTSQADSLPVKRKLSGATPPPPRPFLPADSPILVNPPLEMGSSELQRAADVSTPSIPIILASPPAVGLVTAASPDTSATVPQNESEEDAKTRMKKEFLRKKREREASEAANNVASEVAE